MRVTQIKYFIHSFLHIRGCLKLPLALSAKGWSLKGRRGKENTLPVKTLGEFDGTRRCHQQTPSGYCIDTSGCHIKTSGSRHHIETSGCHVETSVHLLQAIHLLLGVLSAVCAYMQSLPLSMVCWINVQCTKLPPSACCIRVITHCVQCHALALTACVSLRLAHNWRWTYDHRHS